MNCPVCGKEMEPGFVQTNQRAAWVKKPHPLTLMPKDGEILLDNKLFSSCSFPGWICGTARKSSWITAISPARRGDSFSLPIS